MKQATSISNTTTWQRLTRPASACIITLIVLGALALLLRVSYVRVTKVNAPIRADAHQYVVYAWNVLHRGTFSQSIPGETLTADSFRSPGYPLFIALALSIGGPQYLYPIVLYAQAIVGALAVPLTYALGRFFLPRWGALLAAALSAFSPHLVSLGGYVLTETLFCFTVLSSLLMFFGAVRVRKIAYFFGAGIGFGCCYLVNETAVILPFMMVGAQWIGHRTGWFRGPNQRTRGLIVFLAVFSMFPATWTLRNRLNVGRDASTGFNRFVEALTHGSYPGFVHKNPTYKYYPYREDPEYAVFSSSLKQFLQILSQRFQERPGRHLAWYLFEKPYTLWTWNILQGQGDVYIYPVKISLYDTSPLARLTHGLMKLLHPSVLALTLVAYITFVHRLIRHRYRLHAEADTPGYLMLLLLAHTAIYTLTVPWPRYAVPLRPELYLCATWGLVNILTYVRRVLSTPEVGI